MLLGGSQVKTWKEWLEVASSGDTAGESDTIKRIREEVEAKLGRKLPPGAIVESSPAIVELNIGQGSSEEDIAKQVVRALREMTDVVTVDMGKKYNYSAAKLRLLIAEEFYRQATSQPTYQAKNFGDSKLVQ